MRRKKAVALSYDLSLPAPFVTARGEGRTAERMLDLAREAGVPVERNDALAESLVVLEAGCFVPERYWEIVAGIFAFIGGVDRRGS